MYGRARGQPKTHVIGATPGELTTESSRGNFTETKVVSAWNKVYYLVGWEEETR